MVLQINIPKDAVRAARRELNATERELQARIPQATRLTIGDMRRTAVRFLRGERFITPRYIKRRLRQQTRGNKRSLWFGASEIPAEAIRGNIRGRVGKRGLSTKREGAIPRSFVIGLRNVSPIGKKLYLHRVNRRLYPRILSDITEDMETARLVAADAAPAEFRRRLINAIERGRRAQAYRGR